jgi:hypothetical protein
MEENSNGPTFDTILRTVGICYAEPTGTVEYRDGQMTIGVLLMTDDIVTVIPRNGLDETFRSDLHAEAVKAWLSGALGVQWCFVAGVGSICEVVISLPHLLGGGTSDPYALSTRQATSYRLARDLLLRGVSHPTSPGD